MARNDIRKREQEAQEEIELILHQENLSYDFLHEHLRAFVRKKFSLECSDFDETDNLSKLAEISLARMLNISKELVAEYEAGENCDGASSADVKRSLLLVRIQKSFSVNLTLQDLMNIETVEDVAKAIWPHIKKESRQLP